MKTKIFTQNVDLAAAAACGGLTLMPMFPLFMEAHGIRYSVVALVITLWGFVSLKQMDTEPQRVEQTPPVFHKPQHRKSSRRLITAAVLVLIIGVTLFGAIKFIGATQTDVTPCLEWTRKDCVKEAQQPPCPQRQQHCREFGIPSYRCVVGAISESRKKLPCALDAAAQTKQPFKLECFPRGERPICPNLNPIPRCTLDTAQTEQPLNKENSNE